MRNYQEEGSLGKRDRTAAMDAIILHAQMKKIEIPDIAMNDIAHQLCKIFPTEIPVGFFCIIVNRVGFNSVPAFHSLHFTWKWELSLRDISTVGFITSVESTWLNRKEEIRKIWMRLLLSSQLVCLMCKSKLNWDHFNQKQKKIFQICKDCCVYSIISFNIYKCLNFTHIFHCNFKKGWWNRRMLHRTLGSNVWVPSKNNSWNVQWYHKGVAHSLEVDRTFFGKNWFTIAT